MDDVRETAFSKPTAPLQADVLWLSSLASVVVIAHFLMGNGYGFHRDELQFLDSARHLQFGFTAYPPMTAFCGRIAIALFGISVQVFRLPAALVNAVSVVVVGLLARELGGGRGAQMLAALAALPVALSFSSVLQYNTFDYLAWGLLALALAKVLRTGDARWWVGVGVAAGLGELSKYSIAFPVVSLLAGVLLLPAQRSALRSRWFWLGVAAMLAIAAPNLVWLASHHFITLKMEHFIHARDVRHGRAKGYFSDQLWFTALGLPIAVAGLISLLRSERFRLLSFLYVGPFVLLALAKGRGYYLLPGYIVLYAAGAVAFERFVARRDPRALQSGLWAVAVTALLLDCVAVTRRMLPIAQPGSKLWQAQMHNRDLGDEVGWPELVAQVAAVRDHLAPEERVRLAVLAENYGEVGALELYGPEHHLPVPISTVNGFHDRGYGPFEPENLIVVGGDPEDLLAHFASCRVAAEVSIPYGVRNEEAEDHPEIFVCHHLKGNWAQVWSESQSFG